MKATGKDALNLIGHWQDVLPPKSFTDRWFDTLEEARAELTERLDRLSRPQR